MFDYSNFYDFIETKNGKEKKPNLHAVNFRRLRSYNKQWKLNKIIFFEYLLFCHKKFGDNFFQSTSHFVESTLVSKNTILNLMKEFEDSGFIKVERQDDKIKGKDFRNKYSLNFDIILKSFRQIYDFGDQEEKDIQEQETILKEWYQFLENNPYNKPDNTSQDDSISKHDISIEKDDSE